MVSMPLEEINMRSLARKNKYSLYDFFEHRSNINFFLKHAAFTAIRNNQPYRYFLFAANRLKMQKFKPRIDLKNCRKMIR